MKYGKLIYILLATSFFLSACKEEKTAQMQRPIANVEVATPTKQNVELWDSYTARIEANKQVQIRARVSGYLEKICFKDGDFVKEGQVLFQIDARPFQATYNASLAQIKETESRVALAKTNLDRAKQLFDAKAISKEILDTRSSDLLVAESNMALAKAKAEESRLNLEFTIVKSPISGYVSRRYVDAGNLISVSSTLLADVVARDTVYVYFEASERDSIKYFKADLFKDLAKNPVPVKIKLMGETEFSHEGKLTYVGNALSALNLELRADVDNKDDTLMSGMYASASMLYKKSNEAILVPEVAVLTDLVGRYVLTVDENSKAVYTPVNVGNLVGDKLIITDGLKGDEKIIVNGIRGVMPNAPVNVVPAK